MKGAGVIGKRIVRIEQERFYNRNSGRLDVNVQALVLEDGTRIWPVTTETDGDYAHDFGVSKPKRRRAKTGSSNKANE